MTDSQSYEIDLEREVAQGVYANLTIANYTQEEFVLDFVFLQPEQQKGRIQSRVVLSPRNAKRLAQMLTQSVADFEQKMGPIDEDPSSSSFRLNYN